MACYVFLEKVGLNKMFSIKSSGNVFADLNIEDAQRHYLKIDHIL
jgi:hypothetical protein